MKTIKFIVSIIIPFAAGAVGSLATSPNIPTWYAHLEKPALNPPNFVFAPVWTLLYLLMGVSLFLVWTTKTSKDKVAAYVAFGAQMGLNAIWSLVFFGLHLPEIAVIVIVALLIGIGITMALFYRIRKIAAYLLIPYLLWVSFATYLTVGVAALN